MDGYNFSYIPERSAYEFEGFWRVNSAYMRDQKCGQSVFGYLEAVRNFSWILLFPKNRNVGIYITIYKYKCFIFVKVVFKSISDSDYLR